MRKQDIVKGGVYRLRWHDGSFTEVEILGERRHPVRQGRYPYAVTGSKVRYSARNLKTGRIVEIKSAAKLRERVA
jgi:hypothetical protein